MRILAFHGDADIVVPYAGFGLLPGIEEWAAAWAERNGCLSPRAEAAIAADVTLFEWSGCDGGSAVALYKVMDGKHSWPGTGDAGRLEDTTGAISATDLAWDFFAAHPAPPA